MDPESRRFMWSVIARIAQEKSSAVVLTTHSMDEAEALSTKIGILQTKGILKCYGSAQHIKNRFGTGFIIDVKIKEIDEDVLWDHVKQYYDPSGKKIDLEMSTTFDDEIINLIRSKMQLLSTEHDI